MAGLETVVKKGASGFANGLAGVTDPVGALISDFDYSFAGIGPADKKRGNDTLYNSIAKAVYSDHDEPMELSTGYIPRVVGNVLGAGTGLGIGYFLWTAAHPALALTVPIIAGGYSLVRAIGRYIKDFSKGEEVGENEWEKGSFLDGLKFGWHNGTSYLANVGQPVESLFTGRGYDNSHIKGSTATHAAKGARRNFACMAGSFLGFVTGAVVNEITLGVQGIYKTVRDIIRTSEGTGPCKEYSPEYKFREEERDGVKTRVRFAA